MAGYGDDTGFAGWLSDNGYTLPGGSPAAAVLRQRGSAYLDAAYEGKWTGTRTDGIMQERAWPRTDATYNCVNAIDNDVIPLPVVYASYRAGYLEAVTPGVLVGPVVSGARVKRERVEGAVEVEYFDDGSLTAGSAGGFIDPTIDGAMASLICEDSGGFFFASIGS